MAEVNIEDCIEKQHIKNDQSWLLISKKHTGSFICQRLCQRKCGPEKMKTVIRHPIKKSYRRNTIDTDHI